MKLLILAGRFPEHGYKGDQLRTRQLVELLAPEHELHVITAGRPSGPDALSELRRFASVTLVAAGPIARSLSALAQLAHGGPAQVGWMTPRRLRQAARRGAVGSDAVIASTVRVVTDRLPAPLIIDHIDALSVNMRDRARLERRLPLRLAAWIEAALMARHERRVARWAAAQITVSELDAAALPQSPLPVVVGLAVTREPASVVVETSTDHERNIDVILTGNMNYPPNIEAARWLAEAIAPELRKTRPNARVMVAGRSAGSLRLTSVEVCSDVSDLGALLRRARVAVVPLRSGTGVPIKLFEAAAAGAAIVATSRAADAAAIEVLRADDTSEFAAAVERLLADETMRAALAARAHLDLAAHEPEVIAAKLSAVLDLAARDGVRDPS
jgi:polysaccharide biosynthesis protein PslH